MKQKEDVFHPINIVNTVGQEIEKVLVAHGLDPNEFLRVDKLRERTCFNDKEIDLLCELIGDKDLAYFIRDYQTDYAEEKIKCEVAYAKGKKAFAKLECLIPLLEKEFDKGRSRLEDILDFFGVETEEEIFSKVAHYQDHFHIRYPHIKVDPIKLCGWIRRCELDFKTISLEAYDPEGLKKWIEEEDWQHRVNDVDFHHPLPERFAQFGVAVISLPFLPDTMIETNQKKIFTGVEWFGEHPIVLVAPGDGEHQQIWTAVLEEIKREVICADNNQK